MAQAEETKLKPISSLEPLQLLQYVPAHCIVICKVCQYAIQPLAISRHLKDYHQIRRQARRPFMRYVASLELREPQDVVIPTIPEAPAPFLPIVNGFACCVPACRYLSISVKCLTTHWKTEHQTANRTDVRWHRVKLQTFFRGNRLKYFEVLQPDPKQEWGRNHSSDARVQGTEDNAGPFDTYRISPPLPERDDNATKGPSNYAVNLDTLDLTLLHHFTTSTCFTLSTDPNIQKIWETVVPEMACANLYLMQGLLACSALHLADLQPSQQQGLTVRAVSHQDRALPLFRSAISSVTDLSCHVVYAFSRLLVIFAFASQQKVERFLLAQKEPENNVSSCLHLIRGGCSMLFSVRHVIQTGPLKWLIPPEEHTGSSTYCEDPRLSSLASLSSLEPDVAWQGEASVVYLNAFLELRMAFLKTYTRGASLTIWDVVQTWPARVSDDFVTLLSDEHPGALILLAHYCILLKQLESYWYMKGYSARLLSRIYTRIGQKWHPWMTWPLQDVSIND